jgi:peptidoglycan hydrolase-like protein with peptidoglycan-binding domain
MSAVVGAAGGVTVALVFDRDNQNADPLDLGVALLNQSCTGKSLLVTAWGTKGSDLGNAIAGDRDAHYLDVNRSCRTAWKSIGTRTYGYVAYLGPYDSRQDACAARMRADNRGSFVTRLHNGNTQAVQCLCYLAPSTLPTLTPRAAADAENDRFVRALQSLLVSMQLLPADDRTGLYDPGTVAAVKTFQSTTTIPPNGVVDLQTWHALTKVGCHGLSD